MINLITPVCIWKTYGSTYTMQKASVSIYGIVAFVVKI